MSRSASAGEGTAELRSLGSRSISWRSGATESRCSHVARIAAGRRAKVNAATGPPIRDDSEQRSTSDTPQGLPNRTSSKISFPPARAFSAMSPTPRA
jgi:hypothetical protein